MASGKELRAAEFERAADVANLLWRENVAQRQRAVPSTQAAQHFQAPAMKIS